MIGTTSVCDWFLMWPIEGVMEILSIKCQCVLPVLIQLSLNMHLNLINSPLTERRVGRESQMHDCKKLLELGSFCFLWTLCYLFCLFWSSPLNAIFLLLGRPPIPSITFQLQSVLLGNAVSRHSRMPLHRI